MNFRDGVGKRIIYVVGKTAPVLDIIIFPFTLLSVVWFRLVRYWGVKNMKASRWTFLKFGMFPIVNHYYEPLFDYRKIPRSDDTITHLRFNDEAQLSFLKNFNFGPELSVIAQDQTAPGEYYYRNGSFGSGDAELYYSIIRKFKPKKILEIGSGYSTLIALKARDRNSMEDDKSATEIICVEPYEMRYLESKNVRLIREKIEDLGPQIFNELNAGDVFFIDSSHIIRPGGDVTYLILKILPMVKSGVMIHFHDIFLPRQYPLAWLRDEFRMWNEQYLLEALLIGNERFEIVSSLNYLKHKYHGHLANPFPVLAGDDDREPCSFWIRKK